MSISSISHLFTSIIIFFPLFFSLSVSDPRITEVAHNCSETRYPPTSPFIPTFISSMDTIAKLVDSSNWGIYSSGKNPSVFALAQCMNDLNHTDCLLCFSQSRTLLPRCIPSTSGRIYLDGCFLRYDNYNFYDESVDPLHDRTFCDLPISTIAQEDYLRLEFAKKVDDVISTVLATADHNGGFGVASTKGGVTSVYALAQCWNSVSGFGCKQCLNQASKQIKKCSPGKQGRSLNAGCFLRYSTDKFFSDEAESLNHQGSTQIGIAIAIALASLALSLLCLFGACIGYKRLANIRAERNNLGRLTSAVSKSNLNFKYETLEKATDFFDPSRKLGQGGAGSVFKGTLTDGRVVAVKRLFFNTRQWVDEFFNEVNLISGIHHKNLVQLLGCSIEGPESLLVYEYVANKSLDQIIFDKNSAQILSWKQRFDIIAGTAEGLAYLHGGTQTRIIHRDIKCSNILVDENLTAKIADFGLARCFAADKTHLSTGIAGTLGYMAPEYLVRGQLTEKADVYSFGVLVLEIVCGKKNNVFMQESGSILQTVWKHYKANTLTNSVDPSLRTNFPEKEASDVLQIGLLCTQASVSLRPSMAEVVQMLQDRDCTVPSPKQPPFLNSSVMDPDASTMTFGMSGTAPDVPADTTRSSISTNSTSFKSSASSSAHRSDSISAGVSVTR